MKSSGLLQCKAFTRSVDGTFVAEASDLGLRAPLRSFTLVDCPVVGQHRSFQFDRVDENSGDIAGWWYVEADGPNKGYSWLKGSPPEKVPVLRALIIND